MRKTKFALTLFIITFQLAATAQNQIAILKKPEWNSISTYDSKYGTSLELTNNTSAMIVTVPKEDFAIVAVDEKLAQKWLTPLTGFPMAMGKLKNNIIVIASTERSYFKSNNNTFKAFTLDESTGKVLSEKIIYDGNKEFVEVPAFYFDKDGSYFKMSSRLTEMKRKLHVGLPIVAAFTVKNIEKRHRSTQNFSIINFDDQLNQKEIIDPIMPDGDTWSISFNKDGSFLITTVDKNLAKLNIATYISSNEKPLKTISIPFNLGKAGDYSPIKCNSGKQVLQNNIAFLYTNPNKDLELLVAKLNFNDGTFISTTEVLDKNHLKEISKSYVPVSKKLDEITINSRYLQVKNIEEFGDKLLVGFASSYQIMYKNVITYYEGSIILNAYNTQLKQLYRQYIPRDYKIMNTNQGADISFSLKNQNLRMIANTNTSASTIVAMYCEMDINSGQMIKTNLIEKDDLKNGYYANTNSISWNPKSITIPYFDTPGMLSNKVDIQLQQLTY